MSPFTRVLVIAIAVIGFLFDTYELLMLPVIGRAALADLLHVPPGDKQVTNWIGQLLWIAAVCGGVFGLLGGWMIDRFGRKRIMVVSILLYSFSPLAAAFSTEIWHFVFFRSTTFIGVCVEAVAAVTWLSELFQEKRDREKAIAWSLAAASLGGLLVTVVYKAIVSHASQLPAIPTAEGVSAHAAWRYTLITGLVPGALILLLMPFVPESLNWKQKKREGTLKRPSFGELFAPGLYRATIVTTILSACGYAAAFGALQLTPSQVMLLRPEVAKPSAEIKKLQSEPKSKANAEAIAVHQRERENYTGDIQFWQELGGLAGRILLAVLVTMIPAGMLLRLILVPGILLFPLTYLEIVKMDYAIFAAAIFFCGLLTVAQFSYLSELLPKVFPLHLRGTGGSFATNVGGRMFGTMAAILNTKLLAVYCGGGPPGVAKAAAIIGGSVYLIAFVTSFFLPKPEETI